MNTPNEEREKANDGELLKQQTPVCGPDCGCHVTGVSSRMRLVLGSVLLVAAATLVARAMIKDNVASADKAAADYAIGDISSARNGAKTAADATAWKEISALSELNTVAANTSAVFVFLPDRKGKAGDAAAAQIQSAVRTIEARGSKLGVFTLKPGAGDYQQITAQVAVPGVLAMVKGRGMKAVSGEITESRLVQAFVGASSGGGCGPSAGSGCCPR